MSFVFSKNKEKRSRSSTGISNSSFVRNVTSRVSGLLPAGITKWFSSPKSSRTNGSAAAADATDSSTEDEALESPVTAPPAKRLRYSSPVRYSQLTTSETTLTSNVITESSSVLYQAKQSPGPTTYRKETNFNSTPIRALSDDIIVDRSETDDLHQHNMVSVIDQTSSLKRNSLFDNNDQQEQASMACAETAANTVKDPPQPHFHSKLLNSPFYSGMTMYGGASSSTYINEPNIKHRKMTYIYETKDDDSVNLSTSSRRVMDLLENYSSPLIDARRIPRYELSELTDVNRTLPDPYTSARSAYKKQELYIPSTASVIRMKARSRLMDSTKAARQIIASHSSTLSFRGYDPINSEEYSEPGFGKSQSKLKTHLTRTSRGDTLSMPESFDLPKAVLQIDDKDLPKFSFEKSDSKTSSDPPNSETFKFSTPLPVNLDRKTFSSPSPAYNFGIPDEAAANISPPKFSFGNCNSPAITNPVTDNKPLMESQIKEQSVITFAKATKQLHAWKCPECWVSNSEDKQTCACCGAKKVSKIEAPKASETTAKFSIREIANSHTNSNKCVNCEKIAATPKITANQLPVANKTSTKWKCPECWIENDESKDNCVCCGSQKCKPAVVLDKAVVVPSAAKAGDDERVICDDKWKCCDCLFENDDSTDDCVCCGRRKSAKSIAVTANVPDKVDVVTSAATNDWRCDDCLITNKPSIDKCAACGGAKPGTKPAVKTLPSFSSSNFFKKPDSKLAEIVEAQKLYWECRVCLANNAKDKIACMCCDTAKDAKDKSPPKFSNFKFDVEPNLGFKFGIDPKLYEKHSTKKVYEDIPSKMEESETNNNNIPESPIFTFPLPAKNKDYKFDGAKTNEDPKPSFSFGIPKQSYTSTYKNLSDIKFPNVLKPVEGTEKPQEVPSISLKTPEIAKSLTGLPTTPDPTANPLNAMNAFLNYSPEIKPVSPDKEITKPKFSFSAVKPSSVGLFEVPASSVATSSLTTQDTVTQPPMLGMFGKTDATVPSPTVSFFSKSDNSTQAPFSFQNNSDMNAAPGTLTTAAQSIAPAMPVAASPAAPPLFSFGSNQSTNPTSAPSEHKKFNFSFSSSTPMFGATPQHNSSAFGLTTNPLSNAPASSPMGITSNPLGGGMNLNPLGGAPSGNTPMFNAPAKENTNMWPNTSEQTNQVNPFMSTPTKPPFTFGATPSPSPFGTPVNNIAQAPVAFGATSQPAQNMFGMNQNNTSQPTLFSNPAATQQPSSMFGNSTLPMFGVQNASPFGGPTPSMATFEAPAMAPAMAPAPTPAFNFGAPQSSPAVFGFGQQPANTMQGMQGMQGVQGMQAAEGTAGAVTGGFAFGPAAAIGQMQFSIGTAPHVAAGRRVRKAVRRMTPR